MTSIKYLLLALFTPLAAKVFAKDVSLYNGNEKMFRTQERMRVMNVLQSMGIPYRVSNDKSILIPDYARENVKKIVAQGFQEQLKTSPPPTDAQ
jgi:flagellar biosynthesis/type III secretory pathway M-ring protein FliF/YscJ